MANYTRVENFTAKDSLDSGDPEKIITGADVDSEFNAIATAITSKQNSPGSIPAGTKMLFIEAAAPTGWTLVTTYNSVVPLIKSSAGTVNTGGNWGIGNTEITLNSPNHTHNHNHTHTLPNHTHSDGSLQVTVGAFSGNKDTGNDAGNMPNATNYTENVFGDTGNPNNLPASGAASVAATSNTSVSITRTGTMTDGNWRPAYVDTIICSKDA